jgi:hypothetical protein
MKALEKILDVLPLPVVAAIAASVLAAWTIKEVRKYSGYGDILYDKYFQSVVILIVLALPAYYAIQFVFAKPSPFRPNEAGVLISRFKSDDKNVVQDQTRETLNLRIGRDTNFSSVRLRALDEEVDDEDAGNVMSKTGAVGLVSGTFVPSNIVWYHVSWKGRSQVAVIPSSGFPAISGFEDQFIEQLRRILTPPKFPEASAECVSDELIRLTHENEQLRKELAAARAPNVEASIAAFRRIRKHVLVIGNANYASLPRLQFPAADARDFASVIRRYAGDSEIRLLTDATKLQMEEAFERILRAVGKDDYFYVYFSGHGWRGVDGGTYLLPIDAAGQETAEIANTGVSLERYISMARQANAKLSVFFLDAFVSDIQAPLESPIVVMSGSGPGQSALEDIKLRRGLFTNYLLEGLSGSASLAGTEGLIRVTDLAAFVTYQVRMASNGLAIPLVTQGASTGDAPLVAFRREETQSPSRR